MPNPYTSTMPPRTQNSATSVTVGTRRKPIASRSCTSTWRPDARALREPEAPLLAATRHQRALGDGARRRDQDPEPAPEQRLDRLDPLARDLVVRLVLAQRLALRIERDRLVGEELQVAEPALGIGRRRAPRRP